MSFRGYKVYSELDMVLSGLELSEYIPLFQEHQVEFSSLLRFTEEDLEKLGITKMGVRKKIIEAIHEIHKKEWEKSSLSNIIYNKNHIR